MSAALLWRYSPALGALWQRCGWPAAVGIVALLSAGAVHGLWMPELQARLADSRDTLGRALRLADSRRAPPAAADESPAQRFRLAFAPAAERHDKVTALLALAHIHGLETRRADLRWTVAEPLSRYQVTVPVIGGYAALRTWVADALQADSALSLDGLQLRRADLASERVEAELRWSVNLRNDASSGGPMTGGGR